ncbi:MAG: amidase [Betaproteobacteria bacterium]|nr:amidase [Betaproteobacteria bacterium]
MSDPAWFSIAECGRAFGRRELSPLELTQHLLDRIARLDPGLNAFLRVMPDSAIQEAKTAEAEIMAGRSRGPLHGIPYALKDIIDVAGLPTTCHSKILADHVASADAPVVTRLRDAGAILLGKAALHEFATGGPAHDLPWPPARNPWNRDLHPGGSSSGSATALAAGFAPAAIGTDTGGSVRNPATCCGLVGMKPTYGAISRAGVFPLSFSLDHVGPMTRTVEDNALLLQALVGRDAADPASVAHPAPDFLSGLRSGVKGLRIGMIEHFYTEDMQADSQQIEAIARAAALLRELGARVEPVRLSPLRVWAACGRVLMQAEQYVIHERWLQQRPQDYCELSRAKLLAGAFLPARDYVKMLQARRVLGAEFTAVMGDFDALITLSGFDLPCRIDSPQDIARTYERQARMPFNVTGTPALAVPTGFSAEGLPLGMQIAGRAFDEAMLYRIAWQYCEAAGWSAGWAAHHPDTERFTA